MQGPSLPAKPLSTAQALELFDRLPPVDTARLIGAWDGEGFPTGHPLDGTLEAFGWAGKRFASVDEGHPLVFRRAGGTFPVHPALVAPALPLVMRWPALRSPAAASVARALLPLLRTRRSRARLRMVRHRDVVTAAMVYDDIPIIDVFRQADDRTLLGVMDAKHIAQPFFFVLRRAG
jgi:hypothetical protein